MTTFSSFTAISNNLARWQTLTAKSPAVATATAYFNANIGNVKSIDDFMSNTRLFNYAMTAFGLTDLINAKALVKKTLTQGVYDANALANTLNNPRLLAFATAFDFNTYDVDTTSRAATTTDVVSAYVQQTMESDQGKSDKGVQLALYFQRKASTITSAFDVLADKNLLTVVQTALGISPMTSAQDIDVQARNLDKKLDYATFSDPAKVQGFIGRFAAQYDANTATAATSASTSSGFGLSNDLLVQLQSFRIGG